MNKITFLIIYFTLSVSNAYCNDTLYLQDFLDVIRSNHPLIKKADLYDEFSDAYQQKGKGVLDPKLQSAYKRKHFSDTDYYTVWQSELKVPTILPLDFSVGYENNEGQFLSNDDTVPNQGLLYGTLNLSLFRGLLFDDQRYRIHTAELKGIQSQIDKNLLTREIIHQAVRSYLEWSTSYYETMLYNDYVNLVRTRHLNVIDLFINGASPAIDTIESIVNLNTAEKNYLETSDKLISKEQKLSLFIWNEEGQALKMSNMVIPENLDELLAYLEEVSLIINPDFENDPSIRKFKNKIELLELSNRLEREQLKPQLDLKYNTIVNLGKDDFGPTLNLNDYKYGVSFEYPILNRKSKGEIQLNEALIDQNELDKQQYQETLANKYEELNRRQVVQQNIWNIANQKITNSESLYQAEILKFQLGESSVFLLNQRERKFLEARTELIKSYLALGELLNDMFYLKLGQL